MPLSLNAFILPEKNKSTVIVHFFKPAIGVEKTTIWSLRLALQLRLVVIIIECDNGFKVYEGAL